MAMELRLPELGENIVSAQVVKILVQPGQAVQVNQPVLELETNKASLELPSPAAGVVAGILVRVGDEATVGQLVMTFESASAAPAPAEPEPAPDAAREAVAGAPPAREPAPAAIPAAAPPAEAPAEGMTAASPSVRRFAREIGVSLAKVAPSGKRVTIDDVKAYARKLNEAAARPAAAPAAHAELPNFGRWGEVERRPMSNIRRATAEHLVDCWQRIPHVTAFDKADITELEGLRRRFADKAEAQGGKLTMAVMVVKTAAAALKVHPKFNASIDMARREVVFKKYIHIGIAVNTERGLLVPVLRDVDGKNMLRIAAEVSQLAEKARQGKLTLEEMQGGTFSVTNLGRVSGTYFTPIVNHPEVAILGMGRTFEEARFVNGACVPRTVLPLSLSYDHRLIDGADGAAFLRWIVEAIEEPLLLSLEG